MSNAPPADLLFLRDGPGALPELLIVRAARTGDDTRIEIIPLTEVQLRDLAEKAPRSLARLPSRKVG